MSFFDVILLITLGAFALFGIWFGLLHTLGSLLGTILGVYLASRYYEPFAAWLVSTTGWGENLSTVVTFTIAFIIINRLVGILFWFINRLFRLISRLPIIASLNRLLGLLFGTIEGLVTVGFILLFLAQFPVSEKLAASVHASAVAPYAINVATYMLPLLPAGFDVIRSGVDTVQNVVAG